MNTSVSPNDLPAESGLLRYTNETFQKVQREVQELKREMAQKNLAQKIHEDREGKILAADHYELLSSTLSRARGIASLLASVFAEECDGLVPRDLCGTAETLEREIRMALVVLDDCRERGGFETVREEGQP